MYGGLDGLEGSGAGGAGCMVVLVGWRSQMLGVQFLLWSLWDGGIWCWGAGCMMVLVGWRGLVLGVQGVCLF